MVRPCASCSRILGALLLLAATGSPSRATEPADAAAATPATGAAADWSSRIQLSGTLNGDFRWQRHGDWATAGSPATTDLYLRRFEIGVQSDLLSWTSATVVLNSEWLGDALNAGDGKLVVDEVHLDATVPGTPLALTLGKRTQPFGVFENDLITDPLAQDAYETQCVGLTAAVNGAHAASLSGTLYKGRVLVSHLFADGLVDTLGVGLAPDRPRTVSSWIVGGTIAPLADVLTLDGAVSSEPGAIRRNITATVALGGALPWHHNVTCDIEYMRALRRDGYADPSAGIPDPSREFREGAFSATVAYKFVLRPPALRGGGNYAGRKAHARSHPVEVALRHERFDDAGLTAALGAWTLKERTSLGGRFTFHEDGRILSFMELEWRRSLRRVPAGVPAAVDQGNAELYARLGLDF